MLGEVREDKTSKMGRAEQETFTVIDSLREGQSKQKQLSAKISYSLPEDYQVKSGKKLGWYVLPFA